MIFNRSLKKLKQEDPNPSLLYSSILYNRQCNVQESLRKLALVVENRNRQSRGGRGGPRAQQKDAVEAISRNNDNMFKLELNRIHVSACT